MKLFKKKYLLLPLMSTLLVACGDTTEQESPEEMEQEATEAVDDVESGEVEDAVVDITVSVDGEEVSDLSQTIEIEPESILIDVMEEEYEVEADEGFVTMIEGYEQEPDNNKYWMYAVNGEDAMVGAHEYELQENDQVEWRLEELE